MQRFGACCILQSEQAPNTLPATIKLTRLGQQKLDSDNLAGAMKAVRDGIADYFGVDDGDKRYTWVYSQQIAKRPAYGVVAEITQ